MRILLLLSLLTLPLLGGLRVPERLGNIAVANMPFGFAVLKDGKLKHIESDCLDGMLRKMTFKQRNAYVIKGGGLELNQANTGEYTLKSVPNLKGGGALGAAIGCWIGKGLVYVVSYAVIGVVSACTGPMAPATFGALTTAFAVPIEAASMAGAVAGGVVAGVATGPV